MNKIRLNFLVLLLFIATLANGQVQVKTSDKSNACFPLYSNGKTATIYYDEADYKVVSIASELFAEDLERVSGQRPDVKASQQPTDNEICVIIGTLGHSQLIDQLAATKLQGADSIRGGWERYIIQIVEHPFDGVSKALVIAGSDARGTAYGVFTVSKAIGVSPWYWWADVVPEHKDNIYISPVSYVSASPSVKYRGTFINDEDWGIQPWAAKKMDPDIQDIGPNTYRKVFELMLRLKANYLWPAMHPCTKAFWYYKENPQLARDYQIVMGSSHHEPMLRDTEWEWNLNYNEEYGKDHGPWRYDINRDEIYRFFDDRVKEAVNNDAIYTVGMRATKDGAMSGPESLDGKKAVLEEVFHDQREILEKRLNRRASEVPQLFCPYKEVLDLYKAGLQVPEDVTILWPDDNFGFIRQLPNAGERQRSGGNGIYYHFSYWGAPQDYLWLCSISLSLISEEMSKAYAFNARTIWVFNVGDIKPAELELDFGMELAWDINSWTPEKAHLFPEYWATNIFGPEFATPIAQIKTEYYRLAASGRPEHMDEIKLSPEAAKQRLSDYRKLADEATQLVAKIPTRLRNAYFQLILYPVQGACLMNEKILFAQESLRLAALGDKQALLYSEKAIQAYTAIQKMTKEYNEKIAGGKWNGMMNAQPRDRKVYNMPKVATAEMIAPKVTTGAKIEAADSLVSEKAAADFSGAKDNRLTLIEGLGVSGNALTVYPAQLASYDVAQLNGAPFADYQLKAKKGLNMIVVKCLPSFPVSPDQNLRYAVSVNGEKPQLVDIAKPVETHEWAADVIRCYAEGRTVYESSKAGKLNVRVYFIDPGLVLNSVSTYIGKQ